MGKKNKGKKKEKKKKAKKKDVEVIDNICPFLLYNSYRKKRLKMSGTVKATSMSISM